MTPTAKVLLSSWSIDPILTVALSVLAIIYLRGWSILHCLTPGLFQRWRLLSFLGGLVTFWLAVNSPLDALSSLLLSAHMVQHIMLLMVAPPLLLLGYPMLPLLRGLPRQWAHDGIAPFFHWMPLRRAGHLLTAPAVCWVFMITTLCVWHIPAAFELALGSASWHKFEHGCFVGAALLFWWPVVRPFPYRPRWPLWFLPIYLLAADLVNTALSATITFCDHVLYQTYAQVPQLFASSALSDQATAGVIMWVPGSLAFLIPAVALAVQILSPAGLLVQPGMTLTKASVSSVPRIKPQPKENDARNRFDLLTVRGLGSLLRSRLVRRTAQVAMLLLAITVIVDGVRGPQSSAVNLAGVLPWTYWRAFVVVALLAAGNFFCMVCPFTLPRELARRAGWRQRSWPRALRSKWFAIVLLILFFWANEGFGIWDKPIWTTWLILDYFVVAFAIDALFRGASFCKYVCPIGQFQFITSLVSPLEVKVRSLDACASCKTHDCLRGNQHQRGCEMDLFLPRKSGNLDCTFCLDCVRACPHDNIGLVATAPGMEAVHDSQRSSIGRFSRRLDLAALALVFVFAAFVNAALMTAPISSWQDRLATRLSLGCPPAITGIILFISLILAPAGLAGSAAYIGQKLSSVSVGTRELLCRFAMCLVPLGAAMWAAHFLFHLNTAWTSGCVAIHRVMQDVGFRWFNAPGIAIGTSSPLISADAMLVTQTVTLDSGLLLALYLAWRVAKAYAPRPRNALCLLAPWAGVAAILFGFGIWVFLQPMEMRGAVGPFQ
jgi:cytochrome c oxidase assembly factor CtaG/ferredoxin